MNSNLPLEYPDEPRLLQAAVYASSNGIVISDARKKDLPLIFVNPGFEKLTGYSAHNALGHNCRFLHRHDRNQEGLERVRLAIRPALPCSVVIRNYRKDGSLFWNEFYISPIRDEAGSVTHFIGIQSDVTTRVQLEQSRDQFFQIASHDLKSPLNAILSTAAILPKIAPPGQTITEDLARILSNIQTRGKEMLSIIEDYLDFRAIEEGQLALRLERVDLRQLAESCVARNRDYAERKGMALALIAPDEPLFVQADPLKCMQVLQNLVGNAIKFSHTQAPVEVHLHGDTKEVIVEVRDQGPGLKRSDLDGVFSKYARLSNMPTGGEKSSGLGLYISKKLIDLHSGKIGVRNNPGPGCTFWFRLPAA